MADHMIEKDVASTDKCPVIYVEWERGSSSCLLPGRNEFPPAALRIGLTPLRGQLVIQRIRSTGARRENGCLQLSGQSTLHENESTKANFGKHARLQCLVL